MFRGGITLVPIKSESDLIPGRIHNSVIFLIWAALIYPVAGMLLKEFTSLSEIHCQIGGIFIGLEFFAAGCWMVWTGKFEFSFKEERTPAQEVPQN